MVIKPIEKCRRCDIICTTNEESRICDHVGPVSREIRRRDWKSHVSSCSLRWSVLVCRRVESFGKLIGGGGWRRSEHQHNRLCNLGRTVSTQGYTKFGTSSSDRHFIAWGTAKLFKQCLLNIRILECWHTTDFKLCNFKHYRFRSSEFGNIEILFTIETL